MSEPLHFENAYKEKHFTDMSLLHALGWRTAFREAIPADYMASEVTDDRWVPVFRESARSSTWHGLLLYRGKTPVCCGSYGSARTGSAAGQGGLIAFDSAGCEGWGEIISLYTHPEEKGRGYGTLLMEEMLRRLQADGYPACLLYVLRENTSARRFYERCGFTWDGAQVEVPFPHGAVCVDLRYTRAL